MDPCGLSSRAGVASAIRHRPGCPTSPTIVTAASDGADTGKETEVATASRPPRSRPAGQRPRTPRILTVLLPMSHIHTAREFSWLVVLGVVLAGDGLFLGSSVLSARRSRRRRLSSPATRDGGAASSVPPGLTRLCRPCRASELARWPRPPTSTSLGGRTKAEHEVPTSVAASPRHAVRLGNGRQC